MTFKWEGYKQAIENEFNIVNKDKQDVPFLLNDAQSDFLQKLRDRTVILKARKLGFSSAALGIAGVKFLFGENERCVSMSFDATAAAKQLERAKHFIRSFEYKNGITLKTKYNSKSEIVYEGVNEQTGRTYTNSLRIGAATSSSFGRGDDITFLHLTEVAFCDNMDQLLTGVTQALVNDAIAVFETTANGYNQFQTFWDKAVLGENGFAPLFYGPEWEYDEEFLAKKRQELGELYPQEYPSTPEEAFLASGRPFFDRQAVKRMLDVSPEPIQAGSMTMDGLWI